MLLEALRGEREYPGSAIEAALARLHRPPAVPDDLPGEWRALLEAMTADDPARRPTAHDVAATMRDVIRGMIITGRGKHEGRKARGLRRKGATRGSASGSAGSPARTVAIASAAVGGLAVAVTLVVTAVAGVLAL